MVCSCKFPHRLDVIPFLWCPFNTTQWDNKMNFVLLLKCFRFRTCHFIEFVFDSRGKSFLVVFYWCHWHCYPRQVFYSSLKSRSCTCKMSHMFNANFYSTQVCGYVCLSLNSREKFLKYNKFSPIFYISIIYLFWMDWTNRF